MRAAEGGAGRDRGQGRRRRYSRARRRLVPDPPCHGQGIRVRGSGDELRHDRVIIRDTVVEDCCESGLTLGRVNGVRVEACRFEGCRNGIVADSCRDVVVSTVTATKNRRHGIVFSVSRTTGTCTTASPSATAARRRTKTKLRGWGIAAGGGPEDRTPNNGFTITDNICEANYAGGITLDPTIADDPKTDEEDESARSWRSARASPGTSAGAGRGGSDMGGDNPFGSHGIHVRNSSNVVVTDNLCHDNHNSGIQVVNSSHVLVQANACYDNDNGIGLFSRTDLTDPDGGLVIGVNMLYRNEQDFVHGPYGKGPRAFPGLRLYGLHGSVEPECHLVANPGTLFEWHDERDQEGALYVKERGSGTKGWVRVERRRRNLRRPAATAADQADVTGRNKLEHEDGTPANPPVLQTAVPNCLSRVPAAVASSICIPRVRAGPNKFLRSSIPA